MGGGTTTSDSDYTPEKRTPQNGERKRTLISIQSSAGSTKDKASVPTSEVATTNDTGEPKAKKINLSITESK